MTDISIITACRNSAATLNQCIDSVSAQDIAAEHIIIDGASTDNTLDIIEKNKGKISRYISEPDQGIYDAMNKGINQASGEIIGILNADDFYPSHEVLNKVLETFEDKEIMASYADLVYVDATDGKTVKRYWKSGEYDVKKFFRGWMPPHPTFFVRRSIYEKYGMFNSDLGTAADYEIMLRFLCKHQIKVKYIQEVLVHMRSGGISNLNLFNRIKANRMDRKAWAVNGLQPYPWTLFLKPARKIGQWVGN